MERIIVVMFFAVCAMAAAALASTPPEAAAGAQAPADTVEARAERLMKARHAARADENRRHACRHTQLDLIGAGAAARGDQAVRNEAERVVMLEQTRHLEVMQRIEAMTEAPAGDVVLLPLQPTDVERAACEDLAERRLTTEGDRAVLERVAARIAAERLQPVD